ncbi:MAG TPA: OmpA family protein [Candidatus Sulfotelmatobacter sp.]|nr:OmpA family protein [Candidatus Sulfotelmatobacter sp.]
MKNRLFVALVLSTAFALAALAQQATSDATQQPAAAAQTAPASQSMASQSTPSQSMTTPDLEPLTAPKPPDFWDGDEPSVASLLMHPFATKAYVRRHVQPIRDRLEELDEITASDKKTIRDIDARAQHGLQLASEKTSLADQHATDAANKAQIAQQTAATLNTRVSADETEIRNVDQYKSGAQTEIRFRPGQTVLSKQAKDALDEIAAQLKSQRGYILEVQGFSSGHGQAAIANSRKMADAVVRYMVLNHEIPAYRMYVLGLGNASEEKHTSGTRVEVSVLKNDLAQTAQQ